MRNTFLKSKMAAMHLALCQNFNFSKSICIWKRFKQTFQELNSFSDTNSVKYKEFQQNINIIVSELMCGLNIELSLEKHAFITQFL